MFWFKGCARCSGDLYIDADIHGPYVACIQCGHHLTNNQLLALVRDLPSFRSAEVEPVGAFTGEAE